MAIALLNSIQMKPRRWLKYDKDRLKSKQFDCFFRIKYYHSGKGTLEIARSGWSLGAFGTGWNRCLIRYFWI